MFIFIVFTDILLSTDILKGEEKCIDFTVNLANPPLPTTLFLREFHAYDFKR